MYSSQNLLMNKTWNVLVAVLSVIFIWQYFHMHSMGDNLINRYVTSARQTQPAQPVQPVQPVQTKEQQIKTEYKNAKFLAVVDSTEKVARNKSDLFCLAKNIFHEAGNQSIKGKMAVAQVTVNRTKDAKFSGTVCQVAYATNQFSWANNHHLRSSRPSGEQWNTSMKVAYDVLYNGKRLKGMEHALYYHADYVHPHWRHVSRLAQIGAHIFYVRNV